MKDIVFVPGLLCTQALFALSESSFGHDALCDVESRGDDLSGATVRITQKDGGTAVKPAILAILMLQPVLVFDDISIFKSVEMTIAFLNTVKVFRMHGFGEQTRPELVNFIRTITEHHGNLRVAVNDLCAQQVIDIHKCRACHQDLFNKALAIAQGLLEGPYPRGIGAQRGLPDG